MGMSTEDLIIKRIEIGIKKLNKGLSSPAELSLGSYFTRLKKLNDGQHDDLLGLYELAIVKHGKLQRVK
jgi:hypothetical protein